jgi:hypothetical protein
MANVYTAIDWTNRNQKILAPGYPKATKDGKNNWSVQYEYLVGDLYPDLAIPNIGETISEKTEKYRSVWFGLVVTSVSLVTSDTLIGFSVLSITYQTLDSSYSSGGVNRPNELIEIDGQIVEKDINSHPSLNTFQKADLKEGGTNSYIVPTMVYRRTTYHRSLPNSVEDAIDNAGKLCVPTRCKISGTQDSNWLKQPVKWSKNGDTVVKTEEWLYADVWNITIDGVVAEIYDTVT